MSGHEEARVRRLEATDVPDPVKVVFDTLARARAGVVPNLFRVAAHRPEIVTILHAHMSAVMGRGEVPVLLKELLSVRVSQINGCEY